MIDYEFNSVVVLNDGTEIIDGRIPKIEPVVLSIPQKMKSSRRKYRRKKKIMVGDLIDEFIDSIWA